MGLIDSRLFPMNTEYTDFSLCHCFLHFSRSVLKIDLATKTDRIVVLLFLQDLYCTSARRRCLTVDVINIFKEC